MKAIACIRLVLLIAVSFLFNFAVMAQSYDWKDESLIPNAGKAQHSEFLKQQYPFPAKPRNQWEVGVSLGNAGIWGDVTSRIPNFGWGVTVRKSLGYVLSMRLAYSGGVTRGLNWQPSFNYGKNAAWSTRYGAPVNFNVGGTITQVMSTNPNIPFTAADNDPVYYNYRTNIHQLAVQGIISLNNIRFHKDKTKFLAYAIGGVGAMIYDTRVNALDANGASYETLFRDVANRYDRTNSNRRNILRDLREGMDDTYETAAQSNTNSGRQLFGQRLLPTIQGGLGIAYKINKNLSVGLESVYTLTKDDLLDGQGWQEAPLGDAVNTRSHDIWHYTSVSVNYNVGKRAVAPLWWLNPLDFIFNEVQSPKHMKMPKTILEDTDNDGVTNQFDLQPNTPAGCPVDARGVSRDTDGDGVPDCKDKELITPTQCQPVNADGVGNCPDPACCKSPGGGAHLLNTCTLTNLPSISFAGQSETLSSDAKVLLGYIVSSLKNNPNCKAIVCGSVSKSKSGQTIGQRRVDAIVKYLIEKGGISSDRVAAQYDCAEGDTSTVEVRAEQK
ncbi:MAG: hypothetical protein KGP35_06655 [Bacteroidetes bacterium]|nr:hypothetical protein [Bacteroidota bacterium]